METAVSSRDALSVIEDHFRFLVDEFGFALTQSADLPATAWYQAGSRGIVIAYDISQSPPFEVKLEDLSAGLALNLSRIMETQGDASGSGDGPLSAEGVETACRRAEAAMRSHAASFLSGDAKGFRYESREAMLVERLRELARNAYFDGDYRLAVILFDALREYWDDRDRETFELARRGETPITRGSWRR